MAEPTQVPRWYLDAFNDDPDGFWWLTGQVAVADISHLVQALTAGMAVMAERAGEDPENIAALLSAPVAKAFEASRKLAAGADLDAAEAISLVADAFEAELRRAEER